MTPAPTSKPDDGTPVPFDPFGLPPFTGEMSEGQRGHAGDAQGRAEGAPSTRQMPIRRSRFERIP